MKFLVDESVEYSVAAFLRSRKYDVVAVTDNFPGSSDEKVLSYSDKEGRILITNDKDFGELIFHLRMLHAGVILLRLQREEASIKIEKLKILLRKYSKKIPGSFVVVSSSKIRIHSRNKSSNKY